jgi:hypothetical protein
MVSATSHRSFVWLIVLAALAAGAGLWLGSRRFGAPCSTRNRGRSRISA